MGCASLKKRAENFTRKIGFVVASTSRSQDPGKVMRDLIFLEKWRASMKSVYGRLM